MINKKIGLKRVVLVMCMGLFFITNTISVRAAQNSPIKVLAAGSLTGAMNAVIKQYSQKTGQVIEARFAPAGLLRESIEAGEKVDIFASANMEHPQLFANRGMATAPIVMVRNHLCAIALPNFGLTSKNILEKMLDPKVGIGTSTPIADPGGDYTWMMFARADSIHPGAKAILEAKAQQLVGGKNTIKVPKGKDVREYYFEQNKIHMTIGYCSGRSTKPDPKFVSIPLPPELAVDANYGLSVFYNGNANKSEVYKFALYLMSPEAQKIMAEYGFIPTTKL